MNIDVELKYLEYYVDYFWDYEYDEDVEDFFIFIKNGNTIVQKKHLRDIMANMEDEGLLSISLLVMILCASSENAEANIKQLNTAIVSENILAKLNVRQQKNMDLKGAFEFLDTIKALPDTFKNGSEKNKLIRTITKHAHYKLPSKQAKHIVENRFNEQFLQIAETELDPIVIYRDFKTLSLLNRLMPNEEVLVRYILGFDNEKEIEIEEEIVAEDETDYIEQLINNNDTFYIGTLIRHLWSGLKLKHIEISPDGKPFGGVQSISNKGNYNKLLLSELAHDEDVFLSRLINNEALYVEMEIPPNKEEIVRVFLIDVSVRNWGTPKVLAYALSLAIALHPKNNMPSEFYLVGNDYYKVDLLDLESTLHSLKKLDLEQNCSVGLKNYNKYSEHDKKTETYFISSLESLQHAEINSVISQNAGFIDFVFSLNPNGQVSFYSVRKGRKHKINSFLVPLQDLWSTTKTVKKKIVRKASKDFTTSHLPLLQFVPEINSGRTMFFKNKYYYFDHKGLFEFENHENKGLRLIASGLELNYQSSFAIQEQNSSLLLYSYNPQQKQIIVQNVQTKEIVRSEVNVSDAYKSKYKLYAFDDVVYLDQPGVLEAFEIQSNGVVKQVADINKMRHSIVYTPHNLYRNNFLKGNPLKASKRNRIEDTLFWTLELDVVTKKIFFENTWFMDFYGREETNYGFFRIHNRKDKKIIKPEIMVDLMFKKLGSNPMQAMKKIKDATGVFGHLNKGDVLVKNISLSKAENLKMIIEKEGAVCYIKTKFLEFIDGSRVSLEINTLVFQSSNTKIPTFYMPFVHDFFIGFSTDHEFAGNEFFLPINHRLTKILTHDFVLKYVNPFIDQIICHAVTD